ncbi:MAG: hypothetical protein A2V70_16700 [Planctomycetes bacterium RBG_13_63_9]|nr:MAG: hypothetical protein A2V70_16700 [Planctomycetes bacterium RBG_13_63_9]
MRETSCVILCATLVLSLTNLYVGYGSNGWLVAGGAIGVCYVLSRVACKIRLTQRQRAEARRVVAASEQAIALVTCRQPVDPGDANGLVEQMLAQSRYCLLLRAQIVSNLTEAQFRRALQALQNATALVPDGEVVLGKIDDALDDGKLDNEEIVATRGRIVQVERFFLDRYPVTNQEYYEFVAGGGYEQMPLWDKPIWPAVLDLVDRSGMPGPRGWRNGCFAAGEEKLPVVGVSWYEASAYARWVGKRLPSDAEWVKAGSWPVTLSATSRLQRKYPWGESMDRTRANLWDSGPERVVPVDQFAEGMSVGGVYQLIGNVWEWTSGSFRGGNHSIDELTLPTPMKNIRGGAFDTYFDNQATCQFASGENPLRRRHNIGFRCAVGVGDLALIYPASRQARQTAVPEADAEEAETAEEVYA